MRTDMLTEEEKQEIIKYGQERIKVMGLFWLYIVFIAFVLDVLLEGILFWTSFCVMRRYAGGFHADSQRKCCAISAGAIICVFLLLKYARLDTLILGLLQGIGYIAILIMAPVDNKNRRLSEVEKKEFRKKAYAAVTLVLIISGLFYREKYLCLVLPVSIAYVILALLLIVGTCKNIIENREVRNRADTNTMSGIDIKIAKEESDNEAENNCKKDLRSSSGENCS